MEKIDEQIRQNIFEPFIGDLFSQREFLIRHIEKRKPKGTRYLKRGVHKQQTLIYKLTTDNKYIVCMKLFLNTLGTTDKMYFTVLSHKEE